MGNKCILIRVKQFPDRPPVTFCWFRYWTLIHSKGQKMPKTVDNVELGAALQSCCIGAGCISYVKDSKV